MLNTDGIIIVHVPVDKTLKSTIEYNKPNPKEFDHVRSYGMDFPIRARDAGFRVKTIAIPDNSKNHKMISWMDLDTNPFYILTKTAGE